MAIPNFAHQISLERASKHEFEETWALPLATMDHSERPVIVGIYGVSGSGKSYLLAQLERNLDDKSFIFWEGSAAIDTIVPGGLENFKKLRADEQAGFRESALRHVQETCKEKRCVGVVTGHFMFWDEGDHEGQAVWTEADQNTFTHIIYLDTPASQVAHLRQQDQRRVRDPVSIRHLDNWKRAEEKCLRALCSTHGILFSRIFPSPALLSKSTALLYDFQRHTVTRNFSKTDDRVDNFVQERQSELKTVLVIDGDRTLAPQDTGHLFWRRICTDRLSWDPQWTPAAVFDGPLGYSHAAFRQVTMLHEEATSDEEYEELCAHLAEQVTPYRDFISLLKRMAKEPRAGVMIVTCGIGRIWEKILEKHELSQHVKVIGGGRISSDFVVTPAVKARLVRRLRHIYRLEALVFGDSPLDLPMLLEADRAFVVVGEERQRSRTMERDLRIAIDENRLQAWQILLPPTVTPRLDLSRLPSILLTDNDLIFRHQQNLSVLHATVKPAAKLLMTPMRDARIAGPDLRERHRLCGWYLAVEYTSMVLGVEEHSIPHVQGHRTEGYRLASEEKTVIVALMRGGEPMALGVSAAFPLASFVHAKVPSDVQPEHFVGRTNVVLVDSVINTGTSVLTFVDYFYHLGSHLRIVVVAGVVQADAVSEGSLLSRWSRQKDLNVVALRVSENKFRGSGSTDTGNRLYNTTYVP